MVRLLPALLLVVACSFAQGPAASARGSGYIGSNVCRACHPDVALNFFKNPHFISQALGNQPPDRTGCEGCHGPGEAHVTANGGRTTIPRAFSLMTPRQVLDACLTCHRQDLTKANIQRSQHTLNNVVCTACHSIHHSPTAQLLLARPQAELCYGCHATVRAQFDMPSKHRVNEGFMKCSDCHNPHGTFQVTWAMSQRPNMVTQALGNEEPCIRCHVDKRGPFAYEHPPVRVEGCEICHYPHGANNTRLLRRPVVFTLCLGCHNGAGNFGVRNNGITQLSPAHNMLQPRFQYCTTCHVRIHGSNSDPLFLR